MVKQLIDLGTSPNKGDGDPLRTAFQKINDNFNELYDGQFADPNSLSSNLIPSTNAQYDIGSFTNKWADLHIADFIYLNGNRLEATTDGRLLINGETPTIVQSTVGSVFGDDSTLLVDGINNSFNLDGTVKGNIIPDVDEAYDIGSPTKKFRDLYLSGTTIYLGDTPLSIDNGTLLIDGVAVSGTGGTGDVQGSVFADDSTLLVDAVNANIPYSVLSGAPIIPADISDLTDTGNLLGSGTGDITFNGVKIQGAGTASGDGNGYSTIELVPDTDLYNNDQYLIIDPTAPQHIHIRAGGTIDASSAELYLGGELNYVRVVDNTGVRLQNRTRNNTFYNFVDPTDFNTATWYESAGTYYVQYTAVNAEIGNLAFTIGDDNENTVTVYYGGGSSQTLTYGSSSSNLGGGVYRFSVVEAPPTSPTVLTAMDFEIWTNRTNSVVLSSNDFEVSVTDDLRLTGSDTVSLRNRSTTEPVSIVTDYDNTSKTWQFGTDGSLTTPGDIVVAGDVTGTTGASTLYVKARPDSNTYIQLNNSVDSVISTVANLEIRTDVSNTAKTWEFDTTGNLTFPDATVQTTAYPGPQGPAGDGVVEGSIYKINIAGNDSTLLVDSDNGKIVGYVENDRFTVDGNDYQVRIGVGAGATTQGTDAIAIGEGAGNYQQGTRSVAIGRGSGNADQGISAVGIGFCAGGAEQGDYAVAIGFKAGRGPMAGDPDPAQPNNSIIINASGDKLNGTNSGLYIDPVREDTGNTAKAIYYNTTTKELTYANPTGGGDAANLVSDNDISLIINSVDSTSYRWNFNQLGFLEIPNINNQLGGIIGDTLGDGNIGIKASEAAGSYVELTNRDGSAGIFVQGDSTLTDPPNIQVAIYTTNSGGMEFYGDGNAQLFSDLSLGNITSINGIAERSLETFSANILTINFNQRNGAVQNISANFTVNLTGFTLLPFHLTTVRVEIEQHSSAGGYPSVLQIDGVAQTIDWEGGVNPAPIGGTRDLAVFYIRNTSSSSTPAYSVIGHYIGGNQTRFDGDVTGSVFADDSTLLVDAVNGNIFGNVEATRLRTTDPNIALGIAAGETNQGVNTIAIGAAAGQANQGTSSIAIGGQAGNTAQGVSAVALGTQAGSTNQGAIAVSLGTQAGATNQGLGAVAVGTQAGIVSQGNYAVALGYLAGANNQPANSIVINASGSGLDGSAAGFYVNPVRNITGTSILQYNATTGEITHSNDINSEEDISIRINLGDSTQRVWRFGEDGDLAFPDGTTQTTAYTGNAATVDILNTNGIDTNYSITFVENRDGAEILRADVDLTFNSWSNTLTAGNVTTGVLKIEDGVHEQFQTKADATGVVAHDCSQGHIIYHTSPDDYFTVNLTNLNLASGYATSITVVVEQGATGYGPNALQIGGAAQTINWQGGSLPASPTANGVDVCVFSILNNNGTYIVLAQVTGFNEVA